MAFLLTLPIVSGLLLWWVIRNDKRRQFVQQRLRVLTHRTVEETPSLHRKIRQQAFFMPQKLHAWVNAEFAATGDRVGPLHLAVVGLLAAVIVVGFTRFVMEFGPEIGIPLGLVGGAIALVVALRAAQSHYRRRFLNEFPDALDLVRRGIRAGLPVNESLVVAAREIPDPVGNELRRALEQAQVGVAMTDALQATADRVRVADFRFLVVALVLQQKTGGSLAETLANLSAVIRARKALRLKAQALSAEAKISAMVLAALPFVVGGAMWFLNNELVQPFFYDPRGRFMVGLAFTSLVTGLIAMYVLVRRAVR